MDRAICHAVRLLTFRELLNVLREVLLEIQFRIDTAPPFWLKFLSVACGQHENVLMKIFGHRGGSWIGLFVMQ